MEFLLIHSLFHILLLNLITPKKKSINVGAESKAKIKYLFFILQNKIDGKTLKVRMIKFPVKLPTNDRT